MEIVLNQTSETALVSEEDYDSINRIKWYFWNGYANASINDGTKRMHRYIIETCMKITIGKKEVVDHINGNKLDNRRENLRVISYGENARNQAKRKESSSKYKGVCWHSLSKSWRAAISVNGKQHVAYYIDEESAAIQYNIWLERFNCITEVKNAVTMKDNFIEWTSSSANKTIPKGLTKLPNGHYRVRKYINKVRVHLGVFKDLDEAIDVFNNTVIEQPVAEPLIDANGVYYIESKGNKIFVDAERYEELSRYTWTTTTQGYAQSKIATKVKLMHRYVLDYDGDDVVDHINGNKLDNRVANLRICTNRENSCNRPKKSNCSSQYIGVCKRGNKWSASIKHKQKLIWLGTYASEEEAARARDAASIKYNKEFSPLNFSIEEV